MTGNLGTVMKESATIALEYIKSNATQLGIDPVYLKTTMCTFMFRKAPPQKMAQVRNKPCLPSLVSLFTQRKVKKSLAMTGNHIAGQGAACRRNQKKNLGR